MEIHLHGYLGYKNFGDDLMLMAFLQEFPKIKDQKIICWFKKDSTLEDIGIWKKRFPYIEFSKYPISFKLFIVNILFKKDIKAIWVGGNCFYSYKDNSHLLWLKNLVSLYNRFNFQFTFLGVGIGNLDEESIVIVKNIMKMVQKIYFRDQSYLKYKVEFERFSFKFGKSGDLALLYKKEDSFDRKHEDYYIFSGHKYFENNVSIISAVKHSLALLQGKIYLVDFHEGDDGDMVFNKKFNDIYEYKIFDSFHEKLNFLNNAKGLISFRLHSLVFADIAKLPNISINYDPKVGSYHSRMQKSNNSLKELGDYFNPEKCFHTEFEFDELIENENSHSRLALNEISSI